MMMINMKLEREQERGRTETETETNTKNKYKRQIQIQKTNKQTQSYNGPSQQPRQDIEGEFRQSNMARYKSVRCTLAQQGVSDERKSIEVRVKGKKRRNRLGIFGNSLWGGNIILSIRFILFIIEQSFGFTQEGLHSIEDKLVMHIFLRKVRFFTTQQYLT